MMQRKLMIGTALYGLAALVTFGRSAAEWQHFQDAHCRTLAERQETGVDCYQPFAGRAVVAGVLWPLYWSWEAWS